MQIAYLLKHSQLPPASLLAKRLLEQKFLAPIFYVICLANNLLIWSQLIFTNLVIPLGLKFG